ncbi:alpha/beta hydrolase family protein [Companilactobacillus sp. HBUAS59544]|uniref:alpha/beta hydrolase family protein n=1 Tax=Companilactobacillus sp. HBUAS59544 TaxID=3109363 RepID=UPI002FEE7B3B
MSKFQKIKKIVLFLTIFIFTFIVTSCTRHQNGPSAGKTTNTSNGAINDSVWHVKNGHENIYGHIYTAKNHPKKMPIAIVSHGLGGDYQELGAYARDLANYGYLVYAFDFPGGSSNEQSTGLKQTQMSLTTEVSDLKVVKAALQKRTDVKKHQVLLVGGSQGGVVSAMMASQNPEDIKGLALMYPAFSMSHDARKQYSTSNQIPATTDLMGFTVGRNYYRDLLKTDVTQAATKYNGPVLIVHGDEDEIVPIKYVGQAADNFSNAEMVILKEAGHGFEGKAQKLAIKKLNKFIRSVN